MVRHGVVLAAPLPVTDKAGKARELVLLEAECLAHFTRCRAAAIGDDVGGHRRAERTVEFIHVLNDLLALFAGGQVEVDVGPLAAVLVEKPLKEQLHPDWINGSDFECIADSRVGCRAAPLYKNSESLAVENEVPDNKEVSGEAELGNQFELVPNLPTGLVEQASLGSRAVAFADAFLYTLFEEAVHRFAVWNRIVRKLIAEIIECEVEPFAHDAGVGDGFWNVAEERAHLAG